MSENEKKIGSADVAEDIYEGTSSSLVRLVDEYAQYRSLLGAFGTGDAKMELKRRFILKMLDEKWIVAVEDALPSMDTIMRHPASALSEYEEVLPIERTKKVTSQSVVHLSQHTDLINEIRSDGVVMPSKLLNFGQEDTYLTYENRFLNTLVLRVYSFVMGRYDAATENGVDEKNIAFLYEQSFEEGERKGKIKLSIEYSEPPKESELPQRNYVTTHDLWKRFEKIVSAVKSLMGSPFVREMGKNYVKPPIMRTNKLQKHVDFRACLNLWEFFETYENTGYETLVQEDLLKPDDQTVRDMMQSVAAQYVLFKKNTNAEDEQITLDSRLSNVFSPKFKDELDDLDEEEYEEEPPKDNILDEVLKSPESADLIDEAIRIALIADEYYVAEATEEEPAAMEEGKVLYKYNYSFLARLIFAQNPTQDFYTELKNHILAYSGVKDKISWHHELFMHRRFKCAMVNVKGKTLYLYLPLNPADYPESKYHHEDVGKKKETELPFLLKIRSRRALKYAFELIDIVMAQIPLKVNEKFVPKDYHLPYADAEELADRRPPLVKRLYEHTEKQPPAPEIKEQIYITYQYSFTARLILAELETQQYYEELKNYTLSFKKVKARMAWSHETFSLGREKLVRFKMRGKTLAVLVNIPAGTELPKFANYVPEPQNPDSGFTYLFKVTSQLAVKYAKELIETAMKAKEIPFGELQNEKYTMPKRSLKYMLTCEPPLVKKIESTKKPFWEGDLADEKKPSFLKRLFNPLFKKQDEEPAKEPVKTEQPPVIAAVPAVDTEDVEEIEEIAEVAEEPIEETVAAEAADEEPIDETAEDTEAEAEAEDSDDDEGEVPEGEGIAAPAEEQTYITYIYSFSARLIQSDIDVQDRYGEIKNYALSFKRAKARMAWSYETVSVGREKIVQFKMRGKNILMLVNLPEDVELPKFGNYEAEPLKNTGSGFTHSFKVSSQLAVKYAKALIETAMNGLNIPFTEQKNENYRQPRHTLSYMLTCEPPLVKKQISNKKPFWMGNDGNPEVVKTTIVPAAEAVPEDENTTYTSYQYSFTARLILADDGVQERYSEIKNHALSFKRAKARTAWSYETVSVGREKIVQFKMRGKNILLLVNLPEGTEAPKFGSYAPAPLKNTGSGFTCSFKVSSQLAVKYAKELIGAAMEANNVPYVEAQNVDYKQPKRTLKSMLTCNPPLVKKTTSNEKPFWVKK